MALFDGQPSSQIQTKTKPVRKDSPNTPRPLLLFTTGAGARGNEFYNLLCGAWFHQRLVDSIQIPVVEKSDFDSSRSVIRPLKDPHLRSKRAPQFRFRCPHVWISAGRRLTSRTFLSRLD